MKHTKVAVLAASGLLVAALAARADEKKMEMPKPGPEIKKLGYFVGTWKSEGELKPNNFGMPAGKYASSDKCEWFSGGFHVVCHSTSKGPMGATHGLGLLGYNSEEKVYTYAGIDSSGMGEMGSKGKVEGEAWTYTSESMMGGKKMWGRYSMMISSPDSYTFKYETSADGNQWALMMDGKATRAGKAAAKK